MFPCSSTPRQLPAELGAGPRSGVSGSSGPSSLTVASGAPRESIEPTSLAGLLGSNSAASARIPLEPSRPGCTYPAISSAPSMPGAPA